MAKNNNGNSSGFAVKTKLHAGVKPDDMTSFFQQLSTLLGAGTPLLRALRAGAEQSESKKLMAILRTVVNDVGAGVTLAEALTRHPKTFEYQWIEMIKAGERSGMLAETVNELTAYIKTRREIKRKVVSAMIYPCIMILVLIGALIVMLGKVVPTFAEFLTDFGGSLPAITQMVIGASDFVRSHMPHLIGGPIGATLALRYYFGTESGSKRKEGIMLRIPLIGQLIVESTMERFAHNMSLLLKSGTPLLASLRIMPDLFRNQGIYGPALYWVYDNVGRGNSLAASMEATRLFPSMVVNMIRVGEESGQLQEVLVEISSFYRAKVEVLVTRVTGLMEPIIVIFMGASVGIILMSIYLPMFQMAGGPG